MRQQCRRTSWYASFTRFCALWLVVLATLPFTAPFAAFDLADLFGTPRTPAATVSSGQVVSSPSQTDDADDAVASDACIERSHPADLCELALVVSPVASRPRPSPAIGFSSAARPSPLSDSPFPIVALRV